MVEEKKELLPALVDITPEMENLMELASVVAEWNTLANCFEEILKSNIKDLNEEINGKLNGILDNLYRNEDNHYEVFLNELNKAIDLRNNYIKNYVKIVKDRHRLNSTELNP